MASLAASNHDALAADFMAFSGCQDLSQATQFLKQCNWNLQDAVELFLAAGSSALSSTPSSSTTSTLNEDLNEGDLRRSTRTMHNDHDSPQVRAPDPVKRQRLLAGPVYAGEPRSSGNSREMFRSFRAEAKQARLRGKSTRRAGVERLTTKQKVLQTMFAPPVDIMFQGDFKMAKNAARSGERWLLVNVNKRDIFDCHALNRDVWRDDYVKATISDSLVFWSDTIENGPGQRFATLYKVADYPHVALIDPRTGEQSKIILSGGQLSATDFVERVQDYVQRHTITSFHTSVPSSASSSSSSSTSSSSAAPATGSSGRKKEEDDGEAALQAALAASMVDDSANSGSGSSGNSSVLGSAAPPPSSSSSSSSSSSTLVSPPPATRDYGVPPTEPDATMKEGTTRLRIRLPSGKHLVRKFNQSDTVRGLFAVVRQMLNEDGSDAMAASKDFELRAGYPPQMLSSMLDDTLQEARLESASVEVV